MKNMSVSDGIGKYIECLSERGASKNTVLNYRIDLMHFRDYLENEGITEVAEINADAVRVFLSSISNCGEAQASVARRLSAIRRFMLWLIENKVIAASPADGIKTPPKTEAHPKIFSYGEIERLLADGVSGKTSQRDRLILELLYGSALLASEVCALLWSDVDLDERMLTIRSGRKTRLVPFGKTVQKLLAEWRELTCSACDAAVIKAKGSHEMLSTRTVDRVAAHAGERVGLDGVTPIALRHSSAAHMLENGAPLKAVQEFLGHDSMASTEKYLSAAAGKEL